MSHNVNWKRNTALFLGGQAITIIGSSMVSYAIMWYMTLETRSGSVLMVYTVAATLPTFFMAPFGGVWADRHDRRNLINIADGCIALVSLAIALAFTAGMDNIWLLLVCLAARSLGQGVQSPAVGALIPQLVPEGHLMRANGIYQSIMSVSLIGSPALGGVLLTFAPIQTVLFVDVVTAAIGISILAFLVKVPKREICESKKHEKPAYFHEMREGLRYIGERRYMKRLFAFFTAYVILIAPAAMLTPLQVTRDFGADVWRLTAVEIGFSAGMAAGGVLISVWTGFKDKMNTIILGAVIIGVMTVGLGLLTNFWLYLACMVAIGISVPIVSTPFTTILQTKSDDEYMGRVIGVLTMLSSVAMPLAMVVFGPLGDIVAIDWLLIATGAAIVILCPIIAADRKVRDEIR
ncbi:MAG: MFS transporter [Clostridiales Family XIII bacterium]|nr:MFS transporter [Clostridiales Family XIII bacterium]